ncbi:hypothetical protein PG987_007489 [Apiospora arundinis]
MAATREPTKTADVVDNEVHSHDTSSPERKSKDDVDSVNEVLHAAGIGLREDDPTLPCLTLRMWTIGIFFCLLGSGVNTLYTFRFPAVTLSQSAIQFLAYPVGKTWQFLVPDWSFSVFGWRLSLNPGPFNYKENMLIYILANLSFLTRLSADVLVEQRVFYGLNAGWGFELLITLATIMYGLALAGLGRPFVVEPKGLVWPGVLSNTALNAALHNSERENSITGTKWRASRYKFFLVAFCISFVWYWFPDFIFPALGYFSWVCWIAPKNAVVNQVFGMKSGMGLLPFTFDWSQIAYIGSPLVVPTWAILNVLASLVFWIYIITPALYYSNTWFTGHLPLQSNLIYDNMGKSYNVSRVVNRRNDFTFDDNKYEQYSQIYLPVTYALNTFGLCLASIASLFVWLALDKRQAIADAVRSCLVPWNRFKAPAKQPGSRQEKGIYNEVPMWWYLCLLLASLGVAIFACEYYPVQLRWYGVIFAMAVSAVFFIPLAWVYATTNVKIQIDIFCRIVAGYVWQGKVLANIWFFDLGYISGIKGLAFAQDLKLDTPAKPLRRAARRPRHGHPGPGLGHELGAEPHPGHLRPERGAQRLHLPLLAHALQHERGLGRPGPQALPGRGRAAPPARLLPLLGAGLTVVVHVVRKRVFPNCRWLQKVHVPLFLGGLNYIPPATGMNYGSWAIVGLLFGLLVKRRARTWWRRYNFVLSSALECSVAIAGIVIFFAIFYTGAAKKFNWWGTTVYTVSQFLFLDS